MRVYKKRNRPHQAKNMEIMKELLIKRREEGMSIRKVAIEFDIDESTLGDWLFYWKSGFKRRPAKREEKHKESGEPRRNREPFSQELQAKIKRNTEENNKRIKYMNQNENTIKIGIE